MCAQSSLTRLHSRANRKVSLNPRTDMTPTRCLILVSMLATAVAAVGQGASRATTPKPDRKKELGEAAEKLKQAKDSMDLEKAREAAEGLLKKLPAKTAESAKGAL